MAIIDKVLMVVMVMVVMVVTLMMVMVMIVLVTMARSGDWLSFAATEGKYS